MKNRVHATIDRFAERGLRSLAVAVQVSIIFELVNDNSMRLLMIIFVLPIPGSPRKDQGKRRRTMEVCWSLASV